MSTSRLNTMTKVQQRSGGLATLAAAAVLGLAACGGSSSPHVASLGSSDANGGAATTTTLPKGNPTQLLDEWATCMRSHGDPSQVDPTIDADKVIHITYPASVKGAGPAGLDQGSADPCGDYLTAASTALRGGLPAQKPDPAKLEEYSRCMRANGIPDFPDPTGNGLHLQVGPGSDLDPNSPTFQSASKLCAKKYDLPGLGGTTPQPGSIEATSGSGPQGGPGGNGGAGSSSGVVIGG
jgi:hypothetical protein